MAVISICMATYNGEQFIREQIDSILAQISPDDELVISDDSSTDSTCSIITSYHDSRIVFLHNDSHNFKWNFYNALRHAKGEYIYLADQDDVWLPCKIQVCQQALRQYDLVVSDCILTDKSLNVIKPSFFSFYHSGPGIIKNCINNTYFGACMAMRRNVLEAAMPFPETIEMGHDIWLGLVAESIGKVKFLKQPLLYYRRHGLALTNLNQPLLTRSKRSLWTKIKSRFIVLYTIFNWRRQHKQC